MLIFLLLTLTGCATGFLNVLAGGGSMLSVPAMVFLGVPGSVANATNRIAILPQNLSAVWVFYKKGFSQFRLSLSLAICTLPGCIIGASLATKISDTVFNTLLASVLILVLIIMHLPQKNISNTGIAPNKTRYLIAHFAMLFIGFWGGFIHIGVGFLIMPVLNRIMQFDLLTTNSHKVFIIFCYTIAALLIFYQEITLLWQYGIALAIGATIGGWVAAHFQIKKGNQVVRVALNIIVVICVIKLLFF